MEAISDYYIYGDGERICYVIAGEKATEELSLHFPDTTFVLLEISDWDRFLSPWKMENPFQRREAFRGEGDVTLSELLSLIPEVEKNGKYRSRSLIGYSMGGLFSLYSSTRTDLFPFIASVSGSLWFKGLKDYLSQNRLYAERIYLSLGKKEKKSSSPVISTVEEKTKEVFSLLSSQSYFVEYKEEEGGHFDNEGQRLINAVSFLEGKNGGRGL